MHLDEIAPFKTWLVVHGVVMKPHEKPTDLVRFDHDGKTGVVRRIGASIKVKPSPFARKYVEAFAAKGPFPNRPERTPGSPKSAKEEAYRRDGGDCFYCGKPLAADVTLEHLLAQSDNGTKQAANIVLTHDACNKMAGNASIAEKVKLRDRIRGHIPILRALANVPPHEPRAKFAKESRPKERLPASVIAASAKATP